MDLSDSFDFVDSGGGGGFFRNRRRHRSSDIPDSGPNSFNSDASPDKKSRHGSGPFGLRNSGKMIFLLISIHL